MKKRLRLYLDTSVWSALSPNSDARMRRLTSQFLFRVAWRHRLLTSKLVFRELSRITDVEIRRAIRRRVRDRRPRVVPVTAQVHRMADDLIEVGCLPEHDLADLYHIAYTIATKADALVTWDMGDLARPRTRMIVGAYLRGLGRAGIRIETPEGVAQWLGVKIR